LTIGDVERVEIALMKLLRSYKIALQYASDMPMLGRSPTKDGGGNWEIPWLLYTPFICSPYRGLVGSRFLTKAYAESHVHKQLQAIRGCLRLERLGASEEVATALTSLEEALDGVVAPLFRWRRLAGLVARLPPIAAAVPVLTALWTWPLAKGVSPDAGRQALGAVVVTALGLWILVVWPSTQIGSRTGARPIRRHNLA
jgi:hypothetical protein